MKFASRPLILACATLFVVTLLPAPSLAQGEADGDADGVVDDYDNCPTTANADQTDMDSDGYGDACGPYSDTNTTGPDPCTSGAPSTQTARNGDPCTAFSQVAPAPQAPPPIPADRAPAAGLGSELGAAFGDPIVVAAAVGGLLVIGLLAYAIGSGRGRKKAKTTATWQTQATTAVAATARNAASG